MGHIGRGHLLDDQVPRHVRTEAAVRRCGVLVATSPETVSRVILIEKAIKCRHIYFFAVFAKLVGLAGTAAAEQSALQKLLKPEEARREVPPYPGSSRGRKALSTAFDVSGDR